MECVYEVSVSVPKEESEAYYHYMITDHIPAILDTGKYKEIVTNVSHDEVLGVAKEEDWVHYKTLYIADSEEMVKSYLTNDAPALRADFLAHCPKDAKISRRVWTVAKKWQRK